MIRWAVMGTGRFALSVLPKINQAAGNTVIAVTSRDPAHARAAAEFARLRAWQRKPTTYNFWCGASASEPEASDWSLEVFLNGQEIAQYSSQHITATPTSAASVASITLVMTTRIVSANTISVSHCIGSM